MNKVRFIIPTLEMEAQALAFKQSFFDHNETTINGSYLLDSEKYTYEAWINLMDRNRHEETAGPRFGVSDTYFAADDEGELVGILNIRYALTEFYKDSGHIGYSVVPQERRKGYATQMLRKALDICREKGMKEVKLVCSSDNIASRRTIMNCGGAVSRIFFKETDCYAEYVIDLYDGILTQYQP